MAGNAWTLRSIEELKAPIYICAKNKLTGRAANKNRTITWTSPERIKRTNSVMKCLCPMCFEECSTSKELLGQEVVCPCCFRLFLAPTQTKDRL